MFFSKGLWIWNFELARLTHCGFEQLPAWHVLRKSLTQLQQVKCTKTEKNVVHMQLLGASWGWVVFFVGPFVEHHGTATAMLVSCGVAALGTCLCTPTAAAQSYRLEVYQKVSSALASCDYHWLPWKSLNKYDDQLSVSYPVMTAGFRHR